MKDSLEGNQAEVLKMKTSTSKQVKELTTTFPPDMLKPNAKADVIFSALADISAACKKYGQVSSPGLPDPSQCYATGKGLEVAIVEKTSTAIFQVMDYKGRPCEEPIMSKQIELVSKLTGTRTRGELKSRGRSQYVISYQPVIKGKHWLHVKVDEQHIRGSPFVIAVMSPVKTLDTPILAVSAVENPWCVAIYQKGEVVITDLRAHCVSVFSPSGKKLHSFGTQGSGEGQFDIPSGVAVDGDGNILVADRDNHRIQKFTAEGQFLTAVGTKGSGHLQFK